MGDTVHGHNDSSRVCARNPVRGKWMIALHDTFLGKVFVEPLTPTAAGSQPPVTVSYASAITAARRWLTSCWPTDPGLSDASPRSSR